jgi:hypothetical protein
LLATLALTVHLGLPDVKSPAMAILTKILTLVNVPHSFMHSWGKNEVVYYFNGEPKHVVEPEKMGSIYKLLPLLYFNPNIGP